MGVRVCACACVYVCIYVHARMCASLLMYLNMNAWAGVYECGGVGIFVG